MPSVQNELHSRDFETGRKCFTQASCYKCHRFAGAGGSIGPDLTTLGRRFDHKTLLESVIEPSKTVSDQYQTSRFVMDDGRVVVGRVINMSNTKLQVMENMLDPGNPATVDRRHVEEVRPSEVSPMPTELLNTFTKQEILDLLAYLRSGGDPEHAMFK